jgi:glycosyltransferase involved in cell wall biosynthesis
MNILLINHYAGSLQLGMEFRPYYMSKKWNEMGHKTTVIGASYSHLRQSQPKKIGWQNIDGLDYLWIWTNKYKGNGVKRFLSMLIFVMQLMFVSVYLAWKTRPRVVIASSTYPLDVFPAWLIAKLSCAKLVFEIHDLWPLSPMELGGMSKWHPFILLMRFGEWFAYKHSDKIVSILPETYEHVKKDGVKKENFIHVPNGIYIKDYQNPLPIPSDLQQLIGREKKKGNVLIGYAGAIGVANAMDVLIEAANILREEKISFIIVGDGQELGNIKTQAQVLQLNNVHFVGRINKLAVHSFLKKMDFLYIGAQHQPMYQFGVGHNKAFDYMMAEKPIIQSLEVGGDVVKKAQAGFNALPGSSVELAKTIRKAIKAPKQKLNQMAKNGKDFVLENHNYDYIAMKFVESIK